MPTSSRVRIQNTIGSKEGTFKGTHTNPWLNDPHLAFLTLLTDFSYLRLDRVLLHLVRAQVLVYGVDEHRKTARAQLCDLSDQESKVCIGEGTPGRELRFELFVLVRVRADVDMWRERRYGKGG